MPHEELTPRSGSVSSGSHSGSGSSPPGAQNSESSSGVHSNASSRRATSVDDLTVHQEPRQTTWKSCSLQRNILPPGAPGSAQIYGFGMQQNPEQVNNLISNFRQAQKFRILLKLFHQTSTSLFFNSFL